MDEQPPTSIDTPDAPPPTPPTRGRSVLVAAIAAVIVVVLAGAGAALWMMRGSGEQLLQAVPAEADVVVAAYLDPTASQKANLIRMLSRFPDLGDAASIRARFDEWADEAFADLGLSHQDLGWVGSQVLVWADVAAEEPQVALVVHSDDPAATSDALDRVRDEMGDGSATEREHEGTTILETEEASWALSDDVLIVGSTGDTVARSLDALAGIAVSLEEAPRFVEVSGELPEGRLGIVYVDAQAIVEGIAGSLPEEVELPDGVDTRFGVTVSAEPDGLAFDVVSVTDTSGMDPEDVAALDAPAEPNEALDAITTDSVVVVGATNIDVGIEAQLEQLAASEPSLADQLEEMGITGPDGLLSALSGDLALGVGSGGSGEVGATLTLGVEDPDRVRTVLGSFVEGVTGGRPEPVMTSGDDVAIFAAPGLPVAWAVSDDLAYVGTTPPALADAIQAANEGSGIATVDRFTEAVDAVGGEDALAYVDVAGVIELVERTMGSSPEGEAFREEVAPYLEPIDLIVAGSEGSAATQHGRLLIRIP